MPCRRGRLSAAERECRGRLLGTASRRSRSAAGVEMGGVEFDVAREGRSLLGRALAPRSPKLPPTRE